MTQAEELWEAASAVGAASRPLPLFYCLSQAGRAICAAWDRDANWRPEAHGLTSRVQDQAEVVPSYSVRVTGRSGMYAKVAAATDSNTFTGPAAVASLWASLPDLPQPRFAPGALRPIYLEPVRVGAEPETPPQTLMRLLAPKHARVVHPMPEALGAALERALEDPDHLGGVVDALRDYPSTRGVAAAVETIRTPFDEERIVALTFPEESGELRPLAEVGDTAPQRTSLSRARDRSTQYVVRPRIGTSATPPPSQLITLWALLYAFSQLARYEPEVWVRALNPDESEIAVDLEHGLDSALELVPELLVPAVTHGLMPRLIREHQADHAARGNHAERGVEDGPDAAPEDRA